MKKLPLLFLCCAALGASVFSASAEGAKKNVLMIAGRPSHGPGEHEHNAGIQLLAKCLAQGAADRVDVKVHLNAEWPTAEELTSLLADNAPETAQTDERTYKWATEVLFEVRKQRSEAKQPLKVPITKVTVKAEAAAIALLPIVEADLRAALRVQAFEASTGEPREILVVGYEALPPA